MSNEVIRPEAFAHEHCVACGSTNIAEGGVRRVGERIVDDERHEVLEYADLTVTCDDCGHKVRTVVTPTEASLVASLRDDKTFEAPIVQAGDTVWKGRVAKGVSFQFQQLGAPLEQDHFWLTISAVPLQPAPDPRETEKFLRRHVKKRKRKRPRHELAILPDLGEEE